MPRSPLAGLALAALLCASPAWATVCAPVRVAPGVASLPEPWKRALDALVHSASAEGRPWSCSGGEIDLALHEGGATLTVTSADGNAVAREVSVPEEIVPLGQALLSRPAAPPEEQPPPPPPLRPAEPPRADAVAPPAAKATDPRLLVSAVIAPRYAGSANLVWGGIAAAIAVPFGAWAVGAMGRYDGPAASLQKREAHLHEFVIGATASRTFATRGFELRTSLVPSVAVVTRGGRMQVNETHVDGRIGFEARGVIPFTSLVRGVIALDGDLAPAEIHGEAHHGPGEQQASFPSYTLGLGVGVELCIR